MSAGLNSAKWSYLRKLRAAQCTCQTSTPYLWRRDFSPRACYCSADGMCRMRVCEWTRRELTLDIRFTGGDYDPGHSGRNREKDSESWGQRERDERLGEREKEAGRAERRPTEMKWGVWSPRDRSGLTGAASGLTQTGCTEHSLWLHIMKRRQCLIVIYVIMCHTTFLSLSLSINIPPFFHQFFALSLHFLSKSFPERHLGFLPASVVPWWSPLFAFIVIDARITPPPFSIFFLKMAIVCVCVSCVWFTCGSLIMTACDSIWFLGYFDSLRFWQKDLQCLKWDQRSRALEKQVSSWEKIRRDTNFGESHCEVHSGRWLP